MVPTWLAIENRLCGWGCILCSLNPDYNITYYKGNELVFVKATVSYYKHKALTGVPSEPSLPGAPPNPYNYNIHTSQNVNSISSHQLWIIDH